MSIYGLGFPSSGGGKGLNAKIVGSVNGFLPLANNTSTLTRDYNINFISENTDYDFLILTTYPISCELDDNAALPNNYPIENIIAKNSTNTILGYYWYLYSSDNYNMGLYDWECTVLNNILTINQSAKISDVKQVSTFTCVAYKYV